MKKERALLILAVWIAILPYLGFPYTFKNILFTLTGLGLIYLAYGFYAQYKMNLKDTKEKTFDNFLENKDFKESTTNTDENHFKGNF